MPVKIITQIMQNAETSALKFAMHVLNTTPESDEITKSTKVR
jgi:hypothetical protein